MTVVNVVFYSHRKNNYAHIQKVYSALHATYAELNAVLESALTG